MNKYMQMGLLVFLTFFYSAAFGVEGTAMNIASDIEFSIQPPDAQDFEKFEYKVNNQRELKLPYTSKALWVRFHLENPSDKELKLVMYWTSALVGTMELYEAGSLQPLQVTGSAIPYHKRMAAGRMPAFQFDLKPRSDQVFYIKRLSHHNLSTRILVSSHEAFQASEADSQAILFFYLGGALCLIVYNLFIGFYSRDPAYFLYTFFAASVSAAALTSQGFFEAFLFRESDFAISQYLMIFSSVAIFASLFFVYRFLNIPQVVPRAKTGFWMIGALASVTLIQGFFPDNEMQSIFGHLVDFAIISMVLFLTSCGVIAFHRGYQLAQFFILSWVSLFIGVFSWFGMTYGLLPNSPWTSYSLLFGNLGEMVILSLGLAYKINILDQEKKQAQTQALEKDRYHRLVKILSHDVANAIMIFSGYVRKLRTMIVEPEKIKTVDKLDIALGNLKDMLTLVKDEESFQAFKHSAVLRPVDLHEVVQEVISFYDDLLASKSLQVEISVPEGSLVMADRTALTNQVLSNLLANSIKFSYPNSKIRITLESSDQWLVLKIKDQGQGMTSEQIQKIFFSREVLSSPGTKREKGSGLGITLVKDYMEIFKGKIEVESVHESISKDSGTSVSLSFPKA